MLGRRKFLRGSVLAAGAASVPFQALFTRTARAQESPFGPLVSDPDGVLDLPAGFSYAILEHVGDPMDDGLQVPGRPDGMGAFMADDGLVVLMRNHENSRGGGPGARPPETYREGDGFEGGVSRLVVDPSDYTRVSSNLVLLGTARNCAGGVFPGAWMSCEESTEDGHGYVFRCPIDATSIRMPERIDAYGRFNHEAAAYDPSTAIAYLTEDRGDSCFYRFVPDDASAPYGAGELQALKVVGADRLDTGDERLGAVLDVEWVGLTDPTPSGDTLRDEAQAAGAAIFQRGEGIDFADGQVFICTTRGGPSGRGQIFMLDPEASTLTVVGESPAGSVLDSPDNIVVAPWGDVIMAEDPGGQPYLRGLTRSGEIYDFARNARSSSELAGVTFSPYGDALFVNMQVDGLTLVITGPFPSVTPPTDGGVDLDAGVTPTADGGAGGDAGSLVDAGAPTDEDGGCGCSAPGAGARDSLGALTGAAILGAAAVRRRGDDDRE